MNIDVNERGLNKREAIILWTMQNLWKNPNFEPSVDEWMAEYDLYMVCYWCKRFIYYKSIRDELTARLIDHHINTYNW